MRVQEPAGWWGSHRAAGALEDGRLEAHMIRKGLPESVPQSFVEDFVRLDATRLLAKTRRAPVRAVLGPGLAEHPRFVPVPCRDHAGPLQRTVTVEVTWTRQHFGGWRGWWRCPSCQRRCGVLLIADERSPVACRRCWRARYTSDYPRSQEQARVRDFLLRRAGGSPAVDRELTLLCARRRRGVQRGRRVFQRAMRLLIKQHEEVLLGCPVSGSRPS